MTRVAVCAATLRRPHGLTALLDSLRQLDLPQDVELRTVIVDNDSTGSARAIVEAAAADWPHWDLVYAIEEKRGIPFARNRGVTEAGDVQWIAFIDDDEVADPAWLRSLLETAHEFEADVVTGRVVPDFEAEPPAWISQGSFFERQRYVTGTSLHYARTSNALVASRWLMGEEGPFSEALANNGGDDTHFFQKVRLSGGHIVWDDNAIVVETVPVTRVRARWLIQREYRRGNTRSLCLRDLEDSPGRRAKRVGAATYHSTVGLGLIALTPVQGRVALVKGSQRLALAAGLLTGLTGHVYEEYTSVHGS